MHLHILRQLGCCDMCKIAIWSEHFFFQVRATGIFARFGFWSHKSIVEWIPRYITDVPLPSAFIVWHVICVWSCITYQPKYTLALPWGPSYIHALILIQAWISNYTHYIMWDEISDPFQTSTTQPLKFWNGWVISSHILLGMWLLIHVLIKFNTC